MSHASLIVAPKKERIAESGLAIAIAWEMEPFKENDVCFADGSRWDWFSIGGRYTGKIDGYDPEKDPANMQICQLCGGSGVRPNGLEQFGVAWFNGNNGCNGCQGTCKYVKWPTKWKDHDGDIALVAQIPPDKPVHAFAFLRERHWHEAERLGWFGTTTYTECERKDMDKPVSDPSKWFGKCLHKDEATGARIVVWNEPQEIWSQEFHKPFVAPLSPDDTIIVVDYHV